LFAPTNEAFNKIDIALLSLADIEDILKIHILVGNVQTFDSLVCNKISKTLLGEDTKTVCANTAARTVLRSSSSGLVHIEKFQQGKGNEETGTKPWIDPVTMKSGNGNVLEVSNVILPGLPPISEFICSEPNFKTLCVLLKSSNNNGNSLLELLEDQDKLFTLFAPSNEAFAAIDAFNLSDQEVTDILLLHIVLDTAETFESLKCNGIVRTALVGQSTETKCSTDGVEKFQKGVGNTGAINESLPKIITPFFIKGNGNVLPLNKVLLPTEPTIGKLFDGCLYNSIMRCSVCLIFLLVLSLF